MKAQKTFLILLLTFFVVSCAPNAVRNPIPLAEFNQRGAGTPLKEYIIGPTDTLDIKFMYNPELNELAVPVRPDGRISLRLVDEVQAAGLSPSELRKVLMEKYAAELNKPEIAVMVRTFNAYKVFLDGEVVYPGPVDLRGPTTLMQALSFARGLRESARLSEIIVIRKDFQGKALSTSVDYRKIIDGTDMSQDILLIPFDIVYVPKSNIANINKFVNEYINGVIPNRFPEFTNFYNPYTFSFGGRTDWAGGQ